MANFLTENIIKFEEVMRKPLVKIKKITNAIEEESEL